MAAKLAATDAASLPRIEIVEERRRVHDAAFRARVVAASLAPGARVEELARRYGICTSLIYRWRRATSGPALRAPAVRLVPVRVADARQAEPRAAVSRAAGSPSANSITSLFAQFVLQKAAEDGASRYRRFVFKDICRSPS